MAADAQVWEIIRRHRAPLFTHTHTCLTTPQPSVHTIAHTQAFTAQRRSYQERGEEKRRGARERGGEDRRTDGR